MEQSSETNMIRREKSMKPLSPKTLQKKYAELGLKQEMISLLHEYYRCFANLYGVITVREAWDVFKHYEGLGLPHKKDFVAFSGVVQREAGLPYSVLELKEVYSGETTESPADRLIVHNDLIGSGHMKWRLIYNTEAHQNGKPYYLPKERAGMLSYTKDRFYQTEAGQRMVRFLSELKTDGRFKDYYGNPCGEILDIDGNPVAGKRLSDFVFYTQDEQFDIEYHKAEWKKERMREKYKTTALDKILSWIRIEIQTGGYILNDSMAETIRFLSEYINNSLGVSLRKRQLEKFIELYTDLNNNSHLWLNCGWSPGGLSEALGRGPVQSISVGPNMKRMLESGELSREEFEKELKALGIKLNT